MNQGQLLTCQGFIWAAKCTLTDRSVCAGEACSMAQMKDSLRNSPARGSELMTGVDHVPRCVIKSTCKAGLWDYICSPKRGSVGLGNISKRERLQRRKFLGFLCVRNGASGLSLTAAPGMVRSADKQPKAACSICPTSGTCDSPAALPRYSTFSSKPERAGPTVLRSQHSGLSLYLSAHQNSPLSAALPSPAHRIGLVHQLQV